MNFRTEQRTRLTSERQYNIHQLHFRKCFSVQPFASAFTASVSYDLKNGKASSNCPGRVNLSREDDILLENVEKTA